MSQLDLFGLSSTPTKPESKPVQKKEVKREMGKVAEEKTTPNIVEIAEAAFNNATAETVAEVEMKPAPAGIIVETLPLPSNERMGSIVFEDSKITVKLKTKPPSAKKVDGDNGQAKENRGQEYPLPGNLPKIEAKKSIVTKQPKSEYSIALNAKLDLVKNSIKEGLLKENIAQKKKEKQQEEKPPQKRGRKSYKDADDGFDLVEIPEDDVLFEKQYYSISEVAGWFHVNTSLLRFWENEFDILKPRKNRKGDRLFRPEDVKNLQLIYQLLRQRKYSLEGAKEYLKANKSKADTELQLTNTLLKFKSFLLELRANLQ